MELGKYKIIPKPEPKTIEIINITGNAISVEEIINGQAYRYSMLLSQLNIDYTIEKI